MGEIRSTLDIIMEKTKGLTLSEEEKEALQRKETEGKVRGLLQKYIDGVLERDQLKAELDGLGETEQAVARTFLKTACLERIEPGVDHSRLLDLLQDLPGLDTAPLRRLLSKHDDELSKRRKKRAQELVQHLKKGGISGSAVIPNIEADAEWQEYMRAAREELRDQIKGLPLSSPPAPT